MHRQTTSPMRRQTAPLWMVTLFALLGLLAGSLLPVVQAQPTGSQFYDVYGVTYISTNDTTTALTGAGVLHTVCVTDAGASANTATIYDNTAGSGTVVALIDTVSFSGCMELDATIATGITVVTATGTAGDLTLTYRGIS